MGCCSRGQCMKIYLVILNFLLILSGLSLGGIAIWMAIEHKGYGDMISGALIWAPMGVGIGLTLLGLLGCFGTIFENRCLVFVYILVTSLLLILSICAGIFIIMQVHDLEKAATEDPNTVSDNSVLDTVTYEAVIFNKCCSVPYGYKAVPECGSAPCYPSSHATSYNYYYEQLDAGFCNILADITVYYEGETVPLVGDSNGGCGNGSASTFYKVMGEYAHQSLIPGATIVLILGFSLLVGMLFGCCFIFLPHKTSTYKPPSDDDDIELSRVHDDEITIN